MHRFKRAHSVLCAGMNEWLTHLCCYFVLTGLCSYHLLIELHAWTHLSFHVNFVFAPTHLGLFMQQWSNLWKKKVRSQIKRDLWGQSSIICLLFATRPSLLMNLIISWLLKAAVKSCFSPTAIWLRPPHIFKCRRKKKAEDLKAAGLFDSRPDRHLRIGDAQCHYQPSCMFFVLISCM